MRSKCISLAHLLCTQQWLPGPVHRHVFLKLCIRDRQAIAPAMLTAFVPLGLAHRTSLPKLTGPPGPRLACYKYTYTYWTNILYMHTCLWHYRHSIRYCCFHLVIPVGTLMLVSAPRSSSVRVAAPVDSPARNLLPLRCCACYLARSELLDLRLLIVLVPLN